MFTLIKKTSLPLLSTVFMMIALGFFNTLVYIELDIMGYSEFVVGLATSLYYAGLLIGSVCISKYVIKHGYIKTYVTFTLIMVISTVIYDITKNIYIWMLLRLVVGFSLAASFVVTQSWLMALSSSSNRGRVLAVYNITLYGSVTIGQILIAFTTNTMTPFLYVSIFIALSILPMTLSNSEVPETKNSVSLSILELFKISKAAKISTIGAGILQSSMYGLLPIYCLMINFKQEQISVLMASMVFGGMLLQYPLGKISDIIERKKVIIVLYILIVLVSLCILLVPANIFILAFLMFLFGGFSFTIYPISLNMLGDKVGPSSLTSINQGVLFSNSFGAIIGPVIASYPIQKFGSSGLFYFNIFIAVLVLGLIYKFNKDREPIEKN
jgi:MFS family permease